MNNALERFNLFMPTIFAESEIKDDAGIKYIYKIFGFD
jgi:hypothetical protein